VAIAESQFSMQNRLPSQDIQCPGNWVQLKVRFPDNLTLEPRFVPAPGNARQTMGHSENRRYTGG
jgi:hypothetical protein